MMNTRHRLSELGLVAISGLLGLLAIVAVTARPGVAAADPACSGDDKDHAIHARGGDHEPRYVLFHDDNTTSMSGDLKDIDHARRFKQPKEQVLWFRDGGQEYVVRDPAVLKRITAMWKPTQELGDAMGKLGTQIGELGRQQGEIGAQQGLLGTRQGALAVREASLSMREANDGDREEIAKQRRELRRQNRALEKQMRALEKPMRELGERMEPLNREMKVLNQKMEVASGKARAEMRVAMKQAISSGTAKPVK